MGTEWIGHVFFWIPRIKIKEKIFFETSIVFINLINTIAKVVIGLYIFYFDKLMEINYYLFYG